MVHEAGFIRQSCLRPEAAGAATRARAGNAGAYAQSRAAAGGKHEEVPSEQTAARVLGTAALTRTQGKIDELRRLGRPVGAPINTNEGALMAPQKRKRAFFRPRRQAAGAGRPADGDGVADAARALAAGSTLEELEALVVEARLAYENADREAQASPGAAALNRFRAAKQALAAAEAALALGPGRSQSS